MAFYPVKITSLLLVALNVDFVVRLPGVASRAASPNVASTVDLSREPSWWEDDAEDGGTLPSASPLTAVKARAGEQPRRHRLRVWKNPKAGESRQEHPSATATEDEDPAKSKGADARVSLPTSDYDEEHPMRTDEWQLDVRLSRLYPKEEGGYFPEYYTDRLAGRDTTDQPSHRLASGRRRSGGGYRKRQVMQFARNGYVKILEEGSDAATGGARRKRPLVGKWRIGHSGVAFEVPVQVQVQRTRGRFKADPDGNKHTPRMTVLHYHADLHLNKFGERPRMFRGVVTRDRHSSFLPPNFLRPVVGTFSAEGIGRDTADTQYRERAISLSRQQAIEGARREAQ